MLTTAGRALLRSVAQGTQQGRLRAPVAVLSSPRWFSASGFNLSGPSGAIWEHARIIHQESNLRRAHNVGAGIVIHVSFTRPSYLSIPAPTLCTLILTLSRERK